MTDFLDGLVKPIDTVTLRSMVDGAVHDAIDQQPGPYYLPGRITTGVLAQVRPLLQDRDARIAEIEADEERRRAYTEKRLEWARAAEAKEWQDRLAEELQARDAASDELETHLAELTERISESVIVHPARIAGQAAIGGTRAPARIIAGLVPDVGEDGVADFYPSVTPAGARAAVRFFEHYQDREEPALTCALDAIRAEIEDMDPDGTMRWLMQDQTREGGDPGNPGNSWWRAYKEVCGLARALHAAETALEDPVDPVAEHEAEYLRAEAMDQHMNDFKYEEGP